jgi:hypothetical protein
VHRISRIDRRYALSLAAAGKLPGTKVGRASAFLADDLVEYLRKRTYSTR